MNWELSNEALHLVRPRGSHFGQIVVNLHLKLLRVVHLGADVQNFDGRQPVGVGVTDDHLAFDVAVLVVEEKLRDEHRVQTGEVQLLQTWEGRWEIIV